MSGLIEKIARVVTGQPSKAEIEYQLNGSALTRPEQPHQIYQCLTDLTEGSKIGGQSGIVTIDDVCLVCGIQKIGRPTSFFCSSTISKIDVLQQGRYSPNFRKSKYNIFICDSLVHALNDMGSTFDSGLYTFRDMSYMIGRMGAYLSFIPGKSAIVEHSYTYNEDGSSDPFYRLR